MYYRGCCLVLLWLILLQAGLVSPSPTPASVDKSDILDPKAFPKQAEAKFRSFPQTFAGFTQRGAYFKSLFPLNNEDAQQENDGNPVVSPWQDPDAVARWGWSTGFSLPPFQRDSTDPNDRDSPSFGRCLDHALIDLQHSQRYVDPKQHVACVSRHNRTFTLEDGSTGQPTDAVHKNTHNPPSSAIIFDWNFGSRFKIAKEKGDISDIPELHHLSDLVYFQWLEACKVKNINPDNIKLIFRSFVSHPFTFYVVRQALLNARIARIPPWEERVTLSMDTDPGLMILGSAAGVAPAFFLIQHKATLGVKKITEVTVWGIRDCPNPEQVDTTGNTILFLRFTVVDAEPSRVGATVSSTDVENGVEAHSAFFEQMSQWNRNGIVAAT
ncbi:hypothetical protein CTA1_10600 [Colletotrichum tanaceti]|uniref:Uncharacterized protein n=1 Tax=Colletotrichum tanaceti TaxID=1306861 RepID=A0A4U6X8B3_9PEZI|nr:hypothetical protein CTA1_10600 [Colletotrichum tanaceti]